MRHALRSRRPVAWARVVAENHRMTEPARSPGEVVQAFFGAMACRDLAAARDVWSDGAVWHTTGDHDLARDYDRDAYFAMLGDWGRRYPDYEAEMKDLREYGDEVVLVYLESSKGMAPGRASGLLVYRVVGGRIVEGWAIPTFGGGRYTF